MLEHLLIQNFAIIEDLDVDFTSGFLALTGETGAGKSIIIDALSLLSGDRSSFEKIRNGKQKAYIEGAFRISNQKTLKVLQEILDEEIEDNLLILSRNLDISGKTTVKINGHSSTISLLKKVTSLVLDIHSQQKDADYLKTSNQLNLLDDFVLEQAKDEEKLIYNSYLSEYNNYQSLLKRSDDLSLRGRELGSLEDLNYQLNELEKADIKPNEMEELEEEKIKLSSFSKNIERLQSFLNEYQTAANALYQAKKQLSYINDDEFSSLSEKFNESYFELEDTYQVINDKYESYADSLNRLEQINDRLFFLHSLRKKYGYTTEDMLLRLEEIKTSIDEISNFDHYQNQLKSQINDSLKALSRISDKLTDVRKKYAEKLQKLVNEQLQDLYLENAEFKVNINKANKHNILGIDEVEFVLKANAGGEFLSLEKTASLGETSRLNLALKTVFNDLNPKDTIIFDEIDIGISGRVAIAVCKKMKKISLKSQVIAISHLPQVCAGGDAHYYVSKEVKNNQTYSSIRLLTEKERIFETAKMMSGGFITSVEIEAAEKLINSLKN